MDDSRQSQTEENETSPVNSIGLSFQMSTMPDNDLLRVVEPNVPASSPTLFDLSSEQSLTSLSWPSLYLAFQDQEAYLPRLILSPQFTSAEINLSQSPSRVDQPIDFSLQSMDSRPESPVSSVEVASMAIRELHRELETMDIHTALRRPLPTDAVAMYAGSVRYFWNSENASSSVPRRATRSDTDLIRRQVEMGPCGPARDINVHPSGARSLINLPRDYSASFVKILDDLRKEFTIYQILVHKTNDDLLEYWSRMSKQGSSPQN